MTRKTSTGNAFLDQDFGEMFDFRKVWAQFQLPGVDGQALIEIQRKNIEAVTQANRIALEGAQAVVQRQSEIARQAMDEMAKALQEVSAAGTAEERVAKQTEFAKQGFETTLKNIRELAEMGSKSNTEAFELINKRVSESFDELGTSLQEIARQSEKAAQSAGPNGGSAASRK